MDGYALAVHVSIAFFPTSYDPIQLKEIIDRIPTSCLKLQPFTISILEGKVQQIPSILQSKQNLTK